VGPVVVTEPAVLPPCPHGDDKSHGGLGHAWCLAGREGLAYVAARETRVAAFRARRSVPSDDVANVLLTTAVPGNVR
jgi:hypothetical protein